MDRFHELKAFVAVVEAGGFSAAARRLGESQSAVSKAIGSLEKRLGVALFIRSTRAVNLTDQGQRYYDRTRPILAELEEADGETTSSTLEVSGLVRIAAAATFGRLHVLPLIPGLLERYPGLAVDIILSDFARDMVDDRIDLAIRVGAVSEPDAVVRRVAGTPLVCVGSRQYLEKYGMPTTPTDLAHHNCLLYGGLAESANWPFVGPEGRFSVTVRGNLSSNSVDAIRAGVLGGVGIGMFAGLSLVDELKHPDIVTILEDFIVDVRDVSLVWPKRRFIAARVRQVTDYFAQALPPRI
jgi:DNA-binding transcriptional LysR family regulator